MEAQINLWVHLLAFAVYTGATLAVIAIGLPVVDSEDDPLRRARLAAAMLRIYDPLSIAALGVVIMTGAFSLTAYKAALRGAFFERLGRAAGLEAVLHVHPGQRRRLRRLRHRPPRGAAPVGRGEPPDAAQLAAFLRRLRGPVHVLALALVAVIVWVAMRMGVAALAPVAAG